MHEQVARARRAARRRRRRPRDGAAAALAVARGDGHARAVRGAGRRTSLDGGATLNPRTYELLAGIHGVAAEEVVVLPNSPNVIMAAERAAELSDKARARGARRAPSRRAWPPRWRSTRPRRATRTPAAMREALEHVAHRRRRARRARRRPGALPAPATRSASSARSIVAWGDARGDAARGARRAWRRGAELRHLHRRATGAPLRRGRRSAALAPPASSSRLATAGSRSWWWLLAAE